MKTKKLSLTLIVTAVIAIVVFFLLRDPYRIKISTSEIQTKLNQQLPFTKTVTVIKVALADARVRTLSDTDTQDNEDNDKDNNNSNKYKLGVDLDLEIKVANKKYIGNIDLNTDIKYDKQQGKIYLDDPEIIKAKIFGLSNERTQIVKLVINQAVKALAEAIPIYTIDPKNTKLFVVKHLLKEIKIVNNGIVVKLGLNN